MATTKELMIFVLFFSQLALGFSAATVTDGKIIRSQNKKLTGKDSPGTDGKIVRRATPQKLEHVTVEANGIQSNPKATEEETSDLGLHSVTVDATKGVLMEDEEAEQESEEEEAEQEEAERASCSDTLGRACWTDGITPTPDPAWGTAFGAVLAPPECVAEDPRLAGRKMLPLRYGLRNKRTKRGTCAKMGSANQLTNANQQDPPEGYGRCETLVSGTWAKPGQYQVCEENAAGKCTGGGGRGGRAARANSCFGLSDPSGDAGDFKCCHWVVCASARAEDSDGNAVACSVKNVCHPALVPVTPLADTFPSFFQFGDLAEVQDAFDRSQVAPHSCVAQNGDMRGRSMLPLGNTCRNRGSDAQTSTCNQLAEAGSIPGTYVLCDDADTQGHCQATSTHDCKAEDGNLDCCNWIVCASSQVQCEVNHCGMKHTEYCDDPSEEGCTSQQGFDFKTISSQKVADVA